MSMQLRVSTVVMPTPGTAVGGLVGQTNKLRFVAPGTNTGAVRFRSTADAATSGRDFQPKESEDYEAPNQGLTDLSRLLFDADVAGEKITVVWFEHMVS